MRYWMIAYLLLFASTVVGQSCKKVEKVLRKVQSLEELTSLHPTWQAKEATVESSAFKTEEAFRKLKAEKVVSYPNESMLTVCKLLEVQQWTEFRVRYIYLDGSKLTETKIETLRAEIIAQYDDGNGTPFADLANQYTMDGNSNGGDLGWFKSGMMVKEFEAAIIEHEQGDLFTVDVPANNWFYVVLKTHADVQKEALKVLRVNCQ